MTDIKTCAKVTYTFLRKILIILKMEGTGHMLAPKSIFLRFPQICSLGFS